MNKVTLSLGQVLALLNPPTHIDSIEDYKQFVHDTLVSDTVPAARKPGRPIQNGHPAYSDEEYRAIKTYLMKQVEVYPEHYRNEEGRLPRGLAKEQPEEESIFVMDNGVKAHFMGRVQIDDGLASPFYPPSVEF